MAGFFVVRIVSKQFAATISAFFFPVTEETEIDAVKIWHKMQILLTNIKQQSPQRFPTEKNIARTSQYQAILYKQNGRSQYILRMTPWKQAKMSLSYAVLCNIHMKMGCPVVYGAQLCQNCTVQQFWRLYVSHLFSHKNLPLLWPVRRLKLTMMRILDPFFGARPSPQWPVHCSGEKSPGSLVRRMQ